MSPILMQAHRGVSTECPENTMAAFKAAVLQGYDVLELDPAVTADGKVVVLHDRTVNRTGRLPDGRKLVEEIPIRSLTLDEARKLDFGRWFSDKFIGEPIPLLREVLSFAAEAGVLVKLDNKFLGFPEEDRRAFYDELLSCGVNEKRVRVGFTTNTLDGTREVLSRFPEAEIHYDGAFDEDTLIALEALVGRERLTVWVPLDCPKTQWVKVPFADEALAAMVKRHASLGVWILSGKAELDEAMALGADIIETTGSIKPFLRQGQTYDMHTHTDASQDSTCPVDDLCTAQEEKGNTGFLISDHANCDRWEGDDVPGCVAGSVAQAEDARKRYDGRVEVLIGTEVGEAIFEERAKTLIDAHAFDAVIGSVHGIKQHVYYSQTDFGVYTEPELYEFMDAYFSCVRKTLDCLPCDILAHLTCPLRYINGKYHRGITVERYADIIDDILKTIIKRGIALEVNTSCIAIGYDALMPDREILRRYASLGGYLVTLASDCHKAENAAIGFEKAKATLKELGFTHICCYRSRTAIPCLL